MKLLLFFALIAIFSAGAKLNYDNYKVYRVVPQNNEQLYFLQDLFTETSAKDYNFWTSLKDVGSSVDVMIAPRVEDDFLLRSKELKLPYEVFIDDVQRRIDGERSKFKSSAFDWTDYQTLEEIQAWLKELPLKFPETTSLVSAGKSYEGRDLMGVKVSFGAENKDRGIFIEGGIHSREWISPATVTYILNQILTSKNGTIRNMATKHDWYFFPNLNPDGYVYTFKSDRMWRKTRKPNGRCIGTDPNRNWNYMWRTGGSSGYPCSETYAGQKPFSEPETLNMARFISSVKDRLIGYIAFHAYSQMLLTPYGHTKSHLENYSELYRVGVEAEKSLSRRYGTRYQVGSISDVIYIASGSSMDWVKGTYHTPITYTYELRDKGRYGFILPAEQIIPTGEETMDSLVTILKGFEGKV